MIYNTRSFPLNLIQYVSIKLLKKNNVARIRTFKAK